MQKVRYEITKHKESGNWVLWEITETEYEDHGSLSTHKLMSGTKKECQEKLKEIKENDKRRRNKNVKKR